MRVSPPRGDGDVGSYNVSFPPFDFSRFQWRPSPEDHRLYIREAAGGEALEDIWNRFNHGEHTLFFGLYLTFSTPIDPLSLLLHARNAWARLRFEVPTIASQTSYNAAGNPLLTYRQALSDQEVDDWTKRTVHLSNNKKGLDHLRYELSRVHLPDENGDQTFLYILPGADDNTHTLLLHTSHTPFDGGGVKILMNKFLSLLAQDLSGDQKPPSLLWGTEAQNLLPSISEVWGPEESRNSEEYMSTLGAVLGDLGAAASRQYGFKQRSIGPGPTRCFRYEFSEAESEQILTAARNLGFTLNHIVHAAVSLVAALDNPRSESTPDDAAFVYYRLVDGRKSLESPYCTRDGYPGYCLGMSAILVPLSLCPRKSSLSATETRECLLKLAEVVKAGYSRQKAYPSLLAVGTQQVDLMLAGVRAGDPPPSPGMGPWYSGDGIGETYLDPVHNDRTGSPVVEISDFMLSLNMTDPGPFFRAASWKGRLKLSVDSNEAAMPHDVVRGFVNTWVEILGTLLNE
ncbi:hypothetical protein K439DRAFT_1653435 [Ramaria rubella]|nr:hypothetical protein K439DRAFT_1653435 [Ramaria rubella]